MQVRRLTTTHIAKWGNSLGLRLPKSVARAARLDEGDQVEVLVKNGPIVIRPSRPTYALCRARVQDHLESNLAAIQSHGDFKRTAIANKVDQL